MSNLTLSSTEPATFLNATLNQTINATTGEPTKAASSTKWILEYWPALIANVFWDINTLPQWIRWMRFLGTPLIMLTGLVGNTFALILMLDRSMRKHTYAWYIMTLAVCDTAMIGVRLCSWINMISLATGGGLLIKITDDVGCILSEGIPDVFQTTGAWMMATIATERFTVVWFPFISRRLTPKISAIVIVGMFIFAILSTLYYIIYIRFVEEVHFCAVPYEIGWVTQLYLGFPMEYIPAMIIIVFNGLVVFSLTRRQRSVKETKKLATKSRDKITFMLMLFTFSFLILTLPAWIFEEIYKKYYGSIPKYVEMPTREIIEFFYQMNYSVNFFIYVISGNELRALFKQKMGACRSALRRNIHASMQNTSDQSESNQRSDKTYKTNVPSLSNEANT
ncbi:uncharacterized protein LOC141907735 [Tubulanus polymorphus]|uniref:uncharacterized protein LOC141907735 n=1 Tax=Tubulanus polymorphus TaxID=672921 RepID=UPI003DA32B6C